MVVTRQKFHYAFLASHFLLIMHEGFWFRGSFSYCQRFYEKRIKKSSLSIYISTSFHHSTGCFLGTDQYARSQKFIAFGWIVQIILVLAFGWILQRMKE